MTAPIPGRHDFCLEDQMSHRTPTISRRLCSSLLDYLFLAFLAGTAAYFLVGIENEQRFGTWGAGLFLVLLFVYEPVFSCHICTLGQKVTGIRVRRYMHPGRLGLGSGYIRLGVKLVSWPLSLLTIPMTMGGRALHDFAAGSIVIYPRPDN